MLGELDQKLPRHEDVEIPLGLGQPTVVLRVGGRRGKRASLGTLGGQPPRATRSVLIPLPGTVSTRLAPSYAAAAALSLTSLLRLGASVNALFVGCFPSHEYKGSPDCRQDEYRG